MWKNRPFLYMGIYVGIHGNTLYENTSIKYSWSLEKDFTLDAERSDFAPSTHFFKSFRNNNEKWKLRYVVGSILVCNLKKRVHTMQFVHVHRMVLICTCLVHAKWLKSAVLYKCCNVHSSYSIVAWSLLTQRFQIVGEFKTYQKSSRWISMFPEH